LSAGGPPEGIEEIFQYARGIPRRVTHVCANSLLAAFIEQKELVGQKPVLRVIQDLNGN